MNLKLLLQITLLSFVNFDFAFGTTFIPTKIEDQLKTSNAVVEGTYQGESYRRLPSGEIVTETKFKVNRSAGLSGNHKLHANSFTVIVPGGEWQDVRQLVTGAPEFSPGERVVLFLQKTAFGFTVNNLGMGKYNFKNLKGKDFLVSSVYPESSKFGKIEFGAFLKLVKERFDEPLALIDSKKVVVKNKLKSNLDVSSNRAPASSNVEQSLGPESNTGPGFIIMLFLFTALGVYSLFRYRS